VRFEEKYIRTIKDFDFKRGDLVLMWNTAIEKSLNRKMKPRYLGQLIVLSRNRGGAYILCELDGSVLRNTVAVFQLVPYFARKSIDLPDGAMDISMEKLREMERQETTEEDEGNGGMWEYEEQLKEEKVDEE
jgi:hypothetical protein